MSLAPCHRTWRCWVMTWMADQPGLSPDTGMVHHVRTGTTTTRGRRGTACCCG